MLQPNDFPLLCLPLDLPPQAVAELIAFLQELIEALERHYGASLKRYYDTIDSAPDGIAADDPPF